MDEPTTGGQLLKLLQLKFGETEPSRLEKLSEVPQNTLKLWERKPGVGLRTGGRDHYRRVFGASASAARPTDEATFRAAVLEALRQIREDHGKVLLKLAEIKGSPPGPRKRAARG